MNSEKTRLKEILSVVKKHNLVKDRTPKNVRNTLEDLGPTFIKMGQILSTRSDLIPESYTKEFQKLRCEVQPMPFSEVQEILKEEYHTDLNEIFEWIEKEPIGSASIAQTHKAKLTTGEIVAIKVQRTNIYQKMSMDARLLKKVISILKLDKLFENIVDIKAVINEMYETSKEEMDFIIEANHIEEFRKNNQEIKYLKPLKVYKELSTRYVLVMEFIEGFFINQVDKLKELGYDMEEISIKLADNYIKQAIDDGFYHADPHGDNIKILDGKIVYLDFGMMGRLSTRNKELLNRCIIAIVKNDISEVAHILMDLDTTRQQVNYMTLTRDIKRVLNRHQTTEISKINIKEFIKDMFQLLNTNNITLPKDVSILVRGIVVIEGVLEEINPEISLMQVSKNRFEIQNLLKKENLEKYAFKGLESIHSLTEVPKETLSLMRGINSGELRFNIELNDSKMHIDRIETVLHQILISILDLALIIGISFMSTTNHKDQPIIYYIYILFSIIFTSWLFLKMTRSKIKRRK